MKPWKPNTLIENNTWILYNDDPYRCIETHTSTNSFDAKKFYSDEAAKAGAIMTKKYAALTSMDQSYYDKCGRVMLRSYKKYWADLMPLHVYNEGGFVPKVKRITVAGWDLGMEYQKFQSRHKNSKVKTFAKKAFPVIHAMNNIECDRLLWLDADTVITAQIHPQMLDLICPDDVLSAHFNVYHSWPSDNNPDRIATSCETGFFVINKNHPGFEEFKNTYTNIYINDDCKDLRRFYDGEVYGKTVQIMEAKGHKMMDLNPGRHKTPISRSIISPYLNHYKAGLKERINFNELENEI